jgi:hypothetical protein
MVKLVIWIDLNAQSVCTYQIWIFLILWCSTRLEDSKDYKFVIFGLTELKIWFKQVSRRFVSNLKIVSNWTHKIWIIIVLLDSRCSKDSNEILFVIFGLTERKLWIFKDSIEIWSEILNRNSFEPEIDMCRSVTGRYRFGWIAVVERRIKRWSDGSDRPVPFRISDLFGPFD